MNRKSTILTVAAVTVLGGLVAYAVYFDYRRRNDVEFRKQLRKESKRIRRAKGSAPPSADAVQLSDDDLRTALETVRKEAVPTSTEEREKYFTEQISIGESLATKDSTFHLASALAFYRGLRVYPAPVELIMIYQKTVPEPIFNILMKLTTMDVKNRAEGYYDYFPPPSMNVTVKAVTVQDADGQPMKKSVLVAAKDFAVGDIIYKEIPMAAALDSDLEGTGSHCSHCFRKIQNGVSLRLQNDPQSSAYCSRDCMQAAKFQYQGILFGTDPLVPAEVTGAPAASDLATRQAAQTKFLAFLKKSGQTQPLLVARLLSHQVAVETAKMLPMLAPPSPRPGQTLPEPDGPFASEYTFADHIERLRYLELQAAPGEFKAVHDALATAVGGFEEFVTDERYLVYKGKCAYNALGVAFGGGRDKKPPSREPPEAREMARTPYGVQRTVGAAFYRVSSYLSHSCTPSTRPSFSSGTNELHLTAARSISKGEELSIAYVEVARRPNESAADCRLRRRMELIQGWRFVCNCSRCTEEGPKRTGQESAALPQGQGDESRVEDVLKKFDTEQATAAV